MPLRELLLLKSMEQYGNKWKGFVVAGTETACGFFNTFEGSCSLLGIKLEKPVKLPLNVLDIEPDGVSGYSMYDVVDGSAASIANIWRENCIEQWGYPKGFREASSSLGFDSLP